MAFGITRARFYGIEASKALTKKFVQHVELSITGTTADVALALGTPGSQFWTDVNNAAVKLAFGQVQGIAQDTISVACPQVEDALVRIATSDTLATGEYKLVSTPAGVAITLFAGEGLTAYRVSLVFALQDNQLPIDYDYTA